MQTSGKLCKSFFGVTISVKNLIVSQALKNVFAWLFFIENDKKNQLLSSKIDRVTTNDTYKKNHYQHFQYGDKYWYFLLGILCLGLEGLHSLCKRRGEELKWVCPSIFIYLASIGKKHACL